MCQMALDAGGPWLFREGTAEIQPGREACVLVMVVQRGLDSRSRVLRKQVNVVVLFLGLFSSTTDFSLNRTA